MIDRINLDATQEAVREFITQLGEIRRPIDIVSGGAVIARLTPPSELSDAEKRRILTAGRAAIERARSRTKDIPAATIRKATDQAVREVRARHAERGR